jgi:hypothetical protein
MQKYRRREKKKEKKKLLVPNWSAIGHMHRFITERMPR